MQPYFMQIYYECSINGFALCKEGKIVGLCADKVKTKLPGRYCLLLQTELYYLRVSEASETLSGLFYRDSQYIYVCVCAS